MSEQGRTPNRESKGTNLGPDFVNRVVRGIGYMMTGDPSAVNVPAGDNNEQTGGRGSILGSDFFGPGSPLPPMAQEEAKSRQWDFPTFYNLVQNPRAYDGVSFEQLRGLADGYDLLRLVIETRKDQVESYEWKLKAKAGKEVPEEVLHQITTFLMMPDKEHTWAAWLRMFLEDLFVLDAVSIYPRQTKGGDLWALEIIDSATIKRVLDSTGRTPLPPEVAYQQVLKGLPAVDYAVGELLYFVRNPRSNRVYGYSPVEQIISTVNIAIRRQITQLNYYTEGNIPEAIAGLPDSWSIDQVKNFQLYWDSIMEGNLAQKRHMRFVPFDPTRIKEMREPVLKDMFDEWLARVVCFAFSLTPTALVKETNRATSESASDQAKAEGLLPMLRWVKAELDLVLIRQFKQPDIEFVWELEDELDPFVQAQCIQIYVGQKAVMTVDEARERINLPPMTEEQKAANAPPPPETMPPMGPNGKPMPPKLGPDGKPIKQPFPPQANAQAKPAGNKFPFNTKGK